MGILSKRNCSHCCHAVGGVRLVRMGSGSGQHFFSFGSGRKRSSLLNSMATVAGRQPSSGAIGSSSGLSLSSPFRPSSRGITTALSSMANTRVTMEWDEEASGRVRVAYVTQARRT